MARVLKLKTFPFHVIGVLLFFITHGYSEYTGLIPISDLAIYFLIVLAITAVIFWLLYRLQRSYIKAGLLTSLVLGFYLFFGAVHDFLKDSSFLAAISGYRYLLSLFLLLLVVLLVLLKRSRKNFQQITLYLNILFIAFIAWDLVNISLDLVKGRHRTFYDPVILEKQQLRTGIDKPDIYFILLDEYSGSHALKQYFNYDNGPFENSLREKGFFVLDSAYTNYSSTPLVLAAILNMHYMQWFPGRKRANPEDYNRAINEISNSEVAGFLRSNGYRIYNHSIFPMGDQPSRFKTGLLPVKLDLLTHKTLFTRMKTDLGWYLQKHISWFADQTQEEYKKGNARLLQLTKNVFNSQHDQPAFVYTHLMMPHHPFIYDSLGNETAKNHWRDKLSPEERNNAYLQYLAYTNKIMAGLVGEILQKTNGHAAIILMSDHGIRGVAGHAKTKTWVNTLNAVYIPGKNYRQFYDSMSNVNQFRAVFNSLFDLQLPFVKDSVGH